MDGVISVIVSVVGIIITMEENGMRNNKISHRINISIEPEC